jgi:hypothetical protein
VTAGGQPDTLPAMRKRKPKKKSPPFTVWSVLVRPTVDVIGTGCGVPFLVIAKTAGKAERFALRAAKRDGLGKPEAVRLERVGELRNGA